MFPNEANEKIHKGYLIQQISKAGNAIYQNTMTAIIDAIGVPKAYEIITKNDIHLDAQENETREKIVKIFINSMDETAIYEYIDNLITSKKVTAKNFAYFFLKNTKYERIILERVGRINHYDREYNDAFLSGMLKYKDLEKEILDIAKKMDDPSGVYGHMVSGYLHNQEVDKAIKLYKKGGIDQRTLTPIMFLKKLISLGETDKAIQYILDDDKLRADFNGSKNYQFEKLQELFVAILDVNHVKAMEFIVHPKIAAIWWGSDLEKFMKTIIEYKVNKNLVFNFLTADASMKKAGPIAIEMAMKQHGKDFNGEDFIKKIINGDELSGILW